MSSSTPPDPASDLRLRIRPLPADVTEETFLPFVELCFNWSMDAETVSREELATRADARHYFADWGRHGDLAVACFDESGGEILGLAWLRLAEDGGVDPDPTPLDVAFSAGLHAAPREPEERAADEVAPETSAPATESFAGYGWVAADIPELSIAVVPEHQGKGIGGALLDALLSLARMSGFDAVSLAVQDGNGAKALYLDHGFSTVGRNGDSDLLVRQLR